MTAGVPGEGLLLMEVNSDEDAIDEFGGTVEPESGAERHDDPGARSHSKRSHKALLPLNRWDSSSSESTLIKRVFQV